MNSESPADLANPVVFWPVRASVIEGTSLGCCKDQWVEVCSYQQVKLPVDTHYFAGGI